MRLRVASSAAAEKLLKERCVPGKTSEVTLKLKLSRPKKERRTAAAPALMTAWAPGYEGSGVVLPTSGSQLVLPAVSGLPSASPARIALTGLQKLYVYFVS